MFWLPIDGHLVGFVSYILAHRPVQIDGFAMLVKISNFEFGAKFDPALLRCKITHE